MVSRWQWAVVASHVYITDDVSVDEAAKREVAVSDWSRPHGLYIAYR